MLPEIILGAVRSIAAGSQTDAGSVITTVGKGTAITGIIDETEEQPFASVRVTRRSAVLFAMMDCVVCPLFQE